MHHDILQDTLKRYPQLEVCAPSIEDSFGLLKGTFKGGGKLLICGNGGSAADAEHVMAELMKAFLKPRKLSDQDKELVGEAFAVQLQGALPAISLVSFSAFHTAFANDCDPAYIFAQLLWGIGKPGDALFAISTSGNSTNVLHAVELANRIGIHTVALTGESGGQLAGLVDVAICVPASRVDQIQELHLPVYHCLCLLLEAHFFRG